MSDIRSIEQITESLANARLSLCDGLFPQRFTLSPSWKSHGRRGDDGVLCEQSLNVLGEGVGRGHAVEPVGDVGA